MIGLPVFEPRDGGGGSSNDGNMCRRILRDHPDILAAECNIPLRFVKGLYILWIALASSLPLSPSKFQAYCDELKDCYVENVGWYPLSPTLHKILEHGSQVVELFPDSITSGLLSEEPSEASNKDVKKFQIEHARQDSVEHRMTDTFHRLLERSDPRVLNILAEQSNVRRKSQDVFPNEVLNLCKDSNEIASTLSLVE